MPSRHLDDFHAAREAGLLADFAQVFPGPALRHAVLKLHLAAAPLELFLDGALLVPAPPGVPRLPRLLPQPDRAVLLTAGRRRGAAKGG